MHGTEATPGSQADRDHAAGGNAVVKVALRYVPQHTRDFKRVGLIRTLGGLRSGTLFQCPVV